MKVASENPSRKDDNKKDEEKEDDMTKIPSVELAKDEDDEWWKRK